MLTFWNNISDAFHADLKGISSQIKKKKGEYLFNEGDVFIGFYVIHSGKFRVFNGNSKGDEATISILESGEMISAVPVLADLPNYHADCQALEDSVVYFFPTKKFKTFVLKTPHFLFEFSKLVTTQFLNIREKYLSLILKNAEQRFVDFLKKSGCKDGFVDLKVSKKNISALLDLTPESLSRIIKKLEESGQIKADKHKFKLLF